MLGAADVGAWASGEPTCVRLNDGALTLPSLEGDMADLRAAAAELPTKLTRRRELRKLQKQARGRTSGKKLQTTLRQGILQESFRWISATRAGGKYAKRAEAALRAQRWAEYGTAVTRWKEAVRRSIVELRELPVGHRFLLRRLALQAKAPRPSPPDVVCSHSKLFRGCTTPDVSHLKKDLRERMKQVSEQREDLRRWRKEKEVEAGTRAMAAAAAAVEIASSPPECMACGMAEACMLQLPCRHVALCRQCWDGRSRAGEVCARCGESSHVSLCVHRP